MEWTYQRGKEVNNNEVEVDKNPPATAVTHHVSGKFRPSLLHHQLEHGLQ